MRLAGGPPRAGRRRRPRRGLRASPPRCRRPACPARRAARHVDGALRGQRRCARAMTWPGAGARPSRAPAPPGTRPALRSALPASSVATSPFSSTVTLGTPSSRASSACRKRWWSVPCTGTKARGRTSSIMRALLLAVRVAAHVDGPRSDHQRAELDAAARRSSIIADDLRLVARDDAARQDDRRPPSPSSSAGCSPRASRASAARASPCDAGRDGRGSRARGSSRARSGGQTRSPGHSRYGRPRAPGGARVARDARVRADAPAEQHDLAAVRGARCRRACAGGARSTRTSPTTTACAARVRRCALERARRRPPRCPWGRARRRSSSR